MKEKIFKNERTCVVCKGKGDKSNLIRLVLTNDKKVLVDKNQNKNGRGCYIHSEKKCLNEIKVIKAINKAFKVNEVNKNSIFDALKEINEMNKKS